MIKKTITRVEYYPFYYLETCRTNQEEVETSEEFEKKYDSIMTLFSELQEELRKMGGFGK